ncbi:hypothetical protein ACFL0X_02895, partial [Nanoarchaeota archaeon]
MGLIRGGLLVIASVLFFVSLLVMGIFLTLDLSLEYENVQPELSAVVFEMANEEQDLTKEVEGNYDVMQLYCQNNSEYVYNEEGYEFVVPCEVVAQGSGAVVEYGVDDFVESVYYDEYDCNFLDCFEKFSEEGEPPFFLVSQKANDYCHSKFFLFLVISILLAVLIFFLVESKTSFPLTVGSLLLISALPFAKLESIFGFMSESFSGLFSIFISKSYRVFLVMFVIGLIVLGFGIVLKFFKIGFKISGFFQRFKKKDSGKNVSKVEKIV